MNTIRSQFNHSIIQFILENEGVIDDCREVGDYITEASRLADEKHIEPPCLNFQRYYNDHIYKLQKLN